MMTGNFFFAISCLRHSTSQIQKSMACLLNAPYKKFIHAQEFYISCFYVISSVNYIRQILSGDILNILQNQTRIATLLAVKPVIAIGKVNSISNIKYNVLLQRCNNRSFLDIMWKKNTAALKWVMTFEKFIWTGSDQIWIDISQCVLGWSRICFRPMCMYKV